MKYPQPPSARAVIIFIGLCILCLALGILWQELATPKPKPQKQTILALPAPVYSEYRVVADGVLENNLTLTPGAVTSMTKEELCAPSFHTKDIRNYAHKEAVCMAYGVDPAHCNGKEYEIDHLIPLELGGSNDIKNKWPQPKTHPGAHEKDILENFMHREVCSGRMPLDEAQKSIALDWYTGYKMIEGLDKNGESR
jgi:hypothetical protein